MNTLSSRLVWEAVAPGHHDRGIKLLCGSAVGLAFFLTSCREPKRDFGPHGPRVYVTNENSNSVSVIDATTDAVIATIPVGKRPRGVRLSPDGQTLYVALSGSPKAPPGVDESTLPAPDRTADGIGVIDVSALRLVRVLPGGQDPESFDITPGGDSMFISNEETAEASVLDIRSGQVTGVVPVGEEPEGVAVRPDGKVVYVTSESSDLVAVIDADTNQVIATISVGEHPRAVVFTPDGARAYVTTEKDASVTVVDATTHTVIDQIAIEGLDGPARPRPMGARVSPDGKTLYVTNGRAGTVSVIDVESGHIQKTISAVGVRPRGIDITPDGRKIYVANGPSNDVSVIDADSDGVRVRIKVGASPWGVAVSK